MFAKVLNKGGTWDAPMEASTSLRILSKASIQKRASKSPCAGTSQGLCKAPMSSNRAPQKLASIPRQCRLFSSI